MGVLAYSPEVCAASGSTFCMDQAKVSGPNVLGSKEISGDCSRISSSPRVVETTEPSHKVINNTFSSVINLPVPVGGFISDPFIHENPPNAFEILGEDCPCNLGSGIGLASVFPKMKV